MKIAVVVFLFGGASGGIKAANTIASQLSDAGHDVYILTCEDVKGTFFDVTKNVQLKTIGKMFTNNEYNEVNAMTEDKEYFFGSMEERFKSQREKQKYVEDMLYRDLTILKPDCMVSVLFQTHSFSIPAAARAGIPVIASEHNSPKSYKELWWMSQDELDYLYFILNFAHKIHILSPMYKEGYPSNLHHKMIDIGNSVDIIYHDLENQIRENCIVAVGELSKWKNYEALIDSFLLVTNEFPDWTLKIFGEGPEKGGLLKRITQNPQLANRVHLMGIVLHKEVLKELEKAKIFCHPSLAESFGLAVAEGLAAGLPAIGLSETDGVNSLIKNEYNGYLVSSDHVVEDMAIALRKLMSDNTHIEIFSNNAKESVKHYSNDAIAKKWNEAVEWIFKPSTIRKSNQQTTDSWLGEKPLISFITICRKNQENILKSTESIWNQTYDQVEHIFIGLGIEVQEKIMQESLHKIDYISSVSDENFYSAIKKGFEYASGDIICILECSDWLDTFAAERAVHAMIAHRKDVVVGAVAVHDGNITNIYKAESLDVSALWTGLSKYHNVIFASRRTYGSFGLYDANYNNFAKFKWFLDVYFNKGTIYYDNSILVHSLNEGPIEIDENEKRIVETLSEHYFDLEGKDTDFLIEFLNHLQEEKSISNGDIERLLTLLKYNINNPDFVYSIIKSLMIKGSSEGLQASFSQIFVVKDSNKSLDTGIKDIHTLKEFLKYNLRGTFLFKPAKLLYKLVKKIKVSKVS